MIKSQVSLNWRRTILVLFIGCEGALESAAANSPKYAHTIDQIPSILLLGLDAALKPEFKLTSLF